MPDYCGRCGSPFEVDLDYGEARPDELFEGGVTDLWKIVALVRVPRDSSTGNADLK